MFVNSFMYLFTVVGHNYIYSLCFNINLRYLYLVFLQCGAGNFTVVKDLTTSSSTNSRVMEVAMVNTQIVSR